MGIESSREAGDARAMMPARAQSIMLGGGIGMPGTTPESNEVLEEVRKEIRKLWLGPIAALPVGKDLPRLIRKMLVFRGETVLTSYESPNHTSLSAFSMPLPVTSPPTTDESSSLRRYDSGLAPSSTEDEIYRVLYSTLTTLRRELDPDRPPLPGETAFRTSVHLDDHSTLMKWILTNIGEESRSIGVLKACNQAILAPAITRLKRELISHSSIRFKDVPGGWKIQIHIDEDASKAPWVAHRRREQVLVQRPLADLVDGGQPDNGGTWAYQFEWELRLMFNRSVQRLPDVQIRLVLIDFTTCSTGAECLPESERHGQEKAFKKALFDVLAITQIAN